MSWTTRKILQKITEDQAAAWKEGLASYVKENVKGVRWISGTFLEKGCAWRAFFFHDEPSGEAPDGTAPAWATTLEGSDWAEKIRAEGCTVQVKTLYLSRAAVVVKRI